MTEILSPAGNAEKLCAALRFGADAVYLAGRQFGMRSAADNFNEAGLAAAFSLAHAQGKKAYLTVNTLPHGAEYPQLRAFLAGLAATPPDGIILADLGVYATVRELLPAVPIHVSTQSSIVSPAAARAWAALPGVTRLVLARELTLDEIRAIREALDPAVELEMFVHGSMCVSYSGRCLLSNHFTGRDANRGQCTQPCRWNYTLMEEKRPGEYLPVEEDAQGTFVMSSKDLCLLRHLPQLVQAGVSSFKIEGRVKSAYYVAAVTNAYRMALDAYQKDPERYEFSEEWMREVESVSHREYCTGFAFDDPQTTAQTVTQGGYLREKAYFATVEAAGVAPAGSDLPLHTPAGTLCLLVQRNKLTRGARAELLSPGRCGVPFTAAELFDEAGAPINATPHPLMRFYAYLPQGASAGDIVRQG